LEKGTENLKDTSFKLRVAAFATCPVTISLREASPNSAGKDAFAI
jgi:hypothetical protein